MLDALAQVYGLDVVVYEPTKEGTLAPVYQAKPLPSKGRKDEASVDSQVNLLLAAQEDEDGELQPHMDRLEGEREKIQVGQRITLHHPEEAGEILKKNGLKIVAPIGEIMLLMDNVKYLRTLMIEELQAEGVSVEESVEAVAQVGEVEQELRQAQAELVQAENEAAQKLQLRQKLRETTKKIDVQSSSNSTSTTEGDFSHIESLFQVGTKDQDILRDLAARQQEIVARHQAALEKRTWLDKASDICLAGVEVLKEIGQEIKTNPFGFAGAIAYEAVDLVTPGGIEAPVEWAKGQRGFASLFARQSVNIAAEAVTGYALGKALKVAGKGLGILKRFASKGMAKVEHKAVQRELEALVAKESYAFKSDIFTQNISWTAPNGTKQIYKVHQRSDINWNMVRTAGDKRFVGKTNKEAAEAGLSPQLPNGCFATLHHIGQDSRGALVEASTHLHSFDSIKLPNGKTPFEVLHSQHGVKVKHPKFPVNHELFKQEVRKYWQNRVK